MNKLTYIKDVKVTPSKAKELEHQGFVLKHVMMHLDGTNTYHVYVK